MVGANQEEHSVVVTGASRGIGRQIAVAFAHETNYALFLLARSKAELIQTQQRCEEAGGNLTAISPVDLTDSKAVKPVVLPNNFPTPKIIINNAGSFLLKPLTETTIDELEKQIQTNLYSAVNTTRRFLDDLQNKSHGLIINICSVGALEGLKDSGAYSASKHALLGYTRSLRKELLDSDIGVTAINLGQTESTSWKGSTIDSKRLIDPEDVGKLIVLLTKLSPRTVIEEIIVKPQHGRVPPM